jgi:hypothetical protein
LLVIWISVGVKKTHGYSFDISRSDLIDDVFKRLFVERGDYFALGVESLWYFEAELARN